MPEAPSAAAGRKFPDDEEELRQLMIRYQQADPVAVEELINRLSPALYRFLAGPDVARHDVEDLLQECWIRIHRSRQTYRPSEPLLPWIFAIARHSRLDGYRRRIRLRTREVLVADVAETSSPSLPPATYRSADIDKSVDALPREQREVIMMLKVSGMSLAEVARATGSTPGAVKQKAHRAYTKLRRMLGDNRHGG
jgi:RNA polymerase sigma-70 factor (ECF subfamily)